MTAKRVEVHRLQEFVRLHRLGTKSAREIARLLKMGRTTEWSYRKALTEAELLAGDPGKLGARGGESGSSGECSSEDAAATGFEGRAVATPDRDDDRARRGPTCDLRPTANGAG